MMACLSVCLFSRVLFMCVCVRYIETNHFIKLRTSEMIKATQEGGGEGGADALSGT